MLFQANVLFSSAQVAFLNFSTESKYTQRSHCSLCETILITSLLIFQRLILKIKHKGTRFIYIKAQQFC